MATQKLKITGTEFKAGSFDSSYLYMYKVTSNAASYIPQGRFIDIDATGDYRIVASDGTYQETTAYSGTYTGEGFIGVSK